MYDFIFLGTDITIKCVIIWIWMHHMDASEAYWEKAGARGVMVIVVGNGHGDTSSNPGWDWLHFT